MKRLVLALALVAAVGACKKAEEQPAQGQMADSSKMMMSDSAPTMMSDSMKMMDTTKR